MVFKGTIDNHIPLLYVTYFEDTIPLLESGIVLFFSHGVFQGLAIDNNLATASFIISSITEIKSYHSIGLHC